MGRQRWGFVVLVLGGAAVGVAVAGVPDRHRDAPLPVEVEAADSSTTSTTAAPPPTTAPVTTTTAPPPTTARTTRTTRRP
jgi:hypothetical protein